MSKRQYPNRVTNADNPCEQEQQKSLKCLSDNNYDKKECTLYFTNYKNCRDFWLTVTLERRRKGISPDLPPASEREKLKAEFMATKPT